MRQVFDIVRTQWVSATPEEIVRQGWINKMVQELGYPKEYMAVEKELPALQRRADIIVYTRAFSPLLLIECKAGDLKRTDLDQVIGYNATVQAPYLALVNARQVVFRYNLACDRCEIDRLPSYQELCDALR